MPIDGDSALYSDVVGLQLSWKDIGRFEIPGSITLKLNVVKTQNTHIFNRSKPDNELQPNFH